MARLARGLLCLLLLVGATSLAMGSLLPPPANETSLDHLARLLRLEGQYEDSWGPMWRAIDHLAGPSPEPVYTAVLFGEKVKFQYPPSSLLLIETTDGLARALGVTPLALLHALSVLALGLNVLVVGRVFAVASARWPLEPAPPRAARVAALALVIALALLYYPLLKAYTLGQVQTLLNLLVALLVERWLAGAQRSAGALAALVAVVKPHFALLLAWAALRRRPRFAQGFLAVAVPALGLSLLRYGWANHVDYLRALAFLSRHGEGFHPNQSLNGLLNRLLFNGNNVEWLSDRFAPYHPVVYAGTLLAGVALVAYVLLGRRGARESGEVADLSLALLGITLASPIAWEHHYGVVPALMAWLLPRLASAGSRSGLSALLASYLLTAPYLPVTERLADTLLNPLQSYLFAGALLLLGLLGAVRAGRLAPEPQRVPDPS